MKCVIDINAVIDIEKSVEDQVRNLDESGMNDFVNGMKEEIKDSLIDGVFYGCNQEDAIKITIDCKISE